MITAWPGLAVTAGVLSSITRLNADLGAAAGRSGTTAGWHVPGSGGGDGPSARLTRDAERGQSGEVDRRCQHREVRGDLHPSPHPSPAPAVPAPHQVSDLAFHLWTRGSVLGLPDRISLPSPARGQV